VLSTTATIGWANLSTGIAHDPHAQSGGWLLGSPVMGEIGPNSED